MKTIIVASENPVKIAAVTYGFQRMFPSDQWEIDGVDVPSGVSHQPMTNTETEQGAHRRVINAKKQTPDADFWVGIEGGVEEIDGNMEAFAWIMVLSNDGMIGKGKTGTFILPFQVATLIRQGKELGEADDIVFQRENSKQQNGAVGILTGDLITRTAYYTEAVILALIPFKNKPYYST